MMDDIDHSCQPPAGRVAVETPACRSPLAPFAECPLCGGAMAAEHAHFRCRPMRAAAAGAFDSWIDIIERRLARDGLDPERAHGLAVELFCAMEGAFLLARTTRSSTPLRIVGSSITAGIQRAITHRMKSLSSGAEK